MRPKSAAATAKALAARSAFDANARTSALRFAFGQFDIASRQCEIKFCIIECKGALCRLVSSVQSGQSSQSLRRPCELCRGAPCTSGFYDAEFDLPLLAREVKRFQERRIVRRHLLRRSTVPSTLADVPVGSGPRATRMFARGHGSCTENHGARTKRCNLAAPRHAERQ